MPWSRLAWTVRHNATDVPSPPALGSLSSMVTSSIPIRTWKDLLFISGKDTRIPLLRVNKMGGRKPSTSVFKHPELDASRLPSHIHLVEDLLSKMHEDLNCIVEEHYAIQQREHLSWTRLVTL
jgi:hypothetical protein